MRYFLSLGSNLGEKKKNLQQAFNLLEEEGIKILRSSSVFNSQPVDFIHQPWFCNQAIEIDTDLSPFLLLKLIKKIEKQMKRQPTIPFGPRIIDIDILLAEKNIIQTKKLNIPHPKMEKRKFVLTALKEISPETIHPLLGENIEDLWKKVPDHSIVRKVKGTVKKSKTKSEKKRQRQQKQEN